MESWLEKQDKLPFQRVEAKEGELEGCSWLKTRHNPKRCKGISGIIKTNTHIMNTLNVSGASLVLEDDQYVDIKKLVSWWSENATRIPNDWDIVRFDCQLPGPSMKKLPSSFDHEWPDIYRTAHMRPCNSSKEVCWFCGGTNAVVLREGKHLAKIKWLWNRKPYDDIDCRLTSHKVHSYCIDADVVKINHTLAHLNDNPKENTDIIRIRQHQSNTNPI